MRRGLFLLSLILAPASVILLILLLGGGTGDPAPVDPIRTLAEDGLPPATRRVEFKLLGADGQPVMGLVCVVLEPELARAAVDAAGLASVQLAATGPLFMMAWAPGHQVLEAGPWEAPPDGGFRLERLSEPELAALAPLELVSWSMKAIGPDGEGLAQALLMARPAGEPDAPPWIGLCGPDGSVTMLASAETLDWELYAPGRLARPTWLLLRQTVDPAADPAGAAIELHPHYASLELSGLPAGEAVELVQDGQVRDLVVASAEGVVSWPILPPGRWTVAMEGAGSREWDLPAGPQRRNWGE